MRRLRELLIGLVAATYPFLIYWGEGRIPTKTLGLVVLVLIALRLAGTPRSGAVKSLVKPALAFLPVLPLAVGASLTGDERLLMAIPVAVSLAFFVTFAGSLLHDRESMVERFARIHRGVQVLPPTAATYCRRITGLWAGFFVVNAAVTASLALWGPMSWWALYSGLIAYLIMGVLMATEYAYRSWRVEPIANREAQAMESPMNAIQESPASDALGSESR